MECSARHRPKSYAAIRRTAQIMPGRSVSSSAADDERSRLPVRDLRSAGKTVSRTEALMQYGFRSREHLRYPGDFWLRDARQRGIRIFRMLPSDQFQVEDNKRVQNGNQPKRYEGGDG